MHSLFLLFIPLVRPWWAQPHALIGRVAETFLTKKQISQLDATLKLNGFNFPSLLHACRWQDDLKSSSHFDGMGSWHFNNNLIIFDDIPVDKPWTYSLSNATSDMWSTLSDPMTTDPWAFSFALASFVHFMGDIHTPHHNCDMFSKEFPNGDGGGNKYNLDCPYGSICSSIHALWDGAGLKYQNANCLDPIYRLVFEKNTTLLMSQYPESQFSEIGEFSPHNWEVESYEAAKTYGYSIPEYADPSPEYLSIVQNISSARIALAGYRMGYLLRELLTTRSVPGAGTAKISVIEVIFWIIDAIGITLSIIFAFLTSKTQRIRSQIQLQLSMN